jgi:hypothetical protein
MLTLVFDVLFKKKIKSFNLSSKQGRDIFNSSESGEN